MLVMEKRVVMGLKHCIGERWGMKYKIAVIINVAYKFAQVQLHINYIPAALNQVSRSSKTPSKEDFPPEDKELFK